MAYSRFADDCNWYIYDALDEGAEPVLVVMYKDKDKVEINLSAQEVQQMLSTSDFQKVRSSLTKDDIAHLRSAFNAWLHDLEQYDSG